SAPQASPHNSIRLGHRQAEQPAAPRRRQRDREAASLRPLFLVCNRLGTPLSSWRVRLFPAAAAALIVLLSPTRRVDFNFRTEEYYNDPHCYRRRFAGAARHDQHQLRPVLLLRRLPAVLRLQLVLLQLSAVLRLRLQPLRLRLSPLVKYSVPA